MSLAMAGDILDLIDLIRSLPTQNVPWFSNGFQTPCSWLYTERIGWTRLPIWSHAVRETLAYWQASELHPSGYLRQQLCGDENRSRLAACGCEVRRASFCCFQNGPGPQHSKSQGVWGSVWVLEEDIKFPFYFKGISWDHWGLNILTKVVWNEFCLCR